MVLFKGLTFNVERDDKIVFIRHDPRAMTALFEIINGNRKAKQGSYEWGQTITTAYLPLDNSAYFDTDMTILDWLEKSTFPLKEMSVLLNACIDSRSRWFVGVSRISTLAPGGSIIRLIIQRIFSPPERTEARLFTSSPLKSIRPRKPLR